VSSVIFSNRSQAYTASPDNPAAEGIILREVLVPSSQVKLSTNEIDKDIVVFDCGNSHTPPIHPLKGMKWRSIKVQDLYDDNKVNGDMGLTFPRIDGALLFIHFATIHGP
jgi:hypothetical protein